MSRILFSLLLSAGLVTTALAKYELSAEQEVYVQDKESQLRFLVLASIRKERAQKRFAYPVAKDYAIREKLDRAILQLELDPTLFILSKAQKVDRGDARATLTDGCIYIGPTIIAGDRDNLLFVLAHEYAHTKLDHPMLLATNAYRMAAMFCFSCIKEKPPVDALSDEGSTVPDSP
jgi:Zn-dependent protease with chaperone function